ncbi:MAG: dienelactone hydrolase family protein [Agarilytica sp.]
MRAFKVIVAIVVAIPVLFFLVGSFLPEKSHMERSAIIDADVATVFYLVSEHKQFQRWSPWAEFDPDMLVEYSGPVIGVGSSMAWSGNEKVGQGTSTVIEYSPNARVVLHMEFGARGGADATFSLESTEGNKTKVTWSLGTQNDFILTKYFGLFLDSMIGRHYERGLQRLNDIAIKQEPIVTETIRYWHNETEYFSYMAYPIGLIDPVPGIIIIHGIWGQGEHERERARMLAKEGYTALVVDLYGQAFHSDDMDEAIAHMDAVGENTQLTEQLFDAALAQLHAHRASDETRTSVVGYSVGGAIAMNMTRKGKNLIAGASFYGGFGGLAEIHEDAFTPAIIFNGDQDQFSVLEQRQQFERDMTAANLEYSIIDYPSGHGFSNPLSTLLGEKAEIGFIRYDEASDKASWQALLTFLDNKNFGSAL